MDVTIGNDPDSRTETEELASAAVFHLRLWPRLGVISASAEVEAVLGFSVTELLDRPACLFDAIAPQDLPAVERAMQGAVGGATHVRFHLRPGGTGEPHPVELFLQPLPGDTSNGVVLVARVRDASLQSPLVISGVDFTEPVGPGSSGSGAMGFSEDSLPTDLWELVQLVVASADLGTRPVTVDGEPVVVQIRPRAVCDAVMAILQNIGDHTPATTKVHVTVAQAMTGALVTVHDDGPGMRWPGGIAAGRYGMADVATVASAGGAGLAAMLEVAERHHGRATIQSAPGRGTVVRILLHDAVAAPQGSARAEPRMMTA